MQNIARLITLFNKKDIVELIKKAKLWAQTPFYDLKRAPSKNEFGRILIIIPKKIGSAPVRNKLRRRIKSIFFEQKIFQLPYDFVIFFKVGADKLDFNYLQDIFKKFIQDS